MSTAEENQTCVSCGCFPSPEIAEIHAMFPRIIPLECEACSTKRDAEYRRRKEEGDRQREQAARESRLQEIPPEMLRTRINHPHFNPGLWLQVEGWQPSSGRWMGIVGGAGECKTRSLALLAHRLILDGHRLMWTTAVEFQDRVDDSIRGERAETKEAGKYFARCKSAAILVLDDFGKNTWNPSMERHLFALIDHRKTHDLPVLWTANTPPLEILATQGLSRDRGAPLIGRLIEISKIIRA